MTGAGYFGAALAAALLATAPARADDAPTPEDGRKAYTSFCARCHGLNLVVSGGGAFDLRRFPADDKARFLHSVNKGLRAMPAWEGIAKPAQIEAIWRYLGSVNGWSPESAAGAVAGADKAAGSSQAQ